MTTNLTEFQQRACSVALVKLLRSKHFSICDLDALAKTMGREQAMAGIDYSALRGLHCVDWADMGPDLARMTREKCFELLGLPAQTIDMVEPASTHEKSDAPATHLRLAFWRGKA